MGNLTQCGGRITDFGRAAEIPGNISDTSAVEDLVTLSPIPLSVLDLANVKEGCTSADALADTERLAVVAEELGFTRFWVAEHHNMPVVASTSPPVLIAHIASRTSKIRVGSGGVMLPNHAPLVVAEQFAMLEALNPGRIDLGIGRAPGTDQPTAKALRRGADGFGAEDFPRDVLDVMAMLGDVRNPDRPLRLRATPVAASHPDIWLLGSSSYSAQLAGMLGLRYSYAHHFGNEDPFAVMDLYRREFRPSNVLSEPYSMLTTSALIADTKEEAEFLAGPAKVMALSLRTGRIGSIVSPEAAAARGFTEQELEVLEYLPAIKFVGDRESVVTRIDNLVRAAQVNEVMFTGSTYSLEDRVRTLKALIAP
ncbi:MAG TPA: LLM class flavin-dependent oxidoreductase [Microthrixaceae bacterium]|nr:LLM class flavin-dependent oxidoreductase [Microthrixaceae bacterium]